MVVGRSIRYEEKYASKEFELTGARWCTNVCQVYFVLLWATMSGSTLFLFHLFIDVVQWFVRYYILVTYGTD